MRRKIDEFFGLGALIAAGFFLFWAGSGSLALAAAGAALLGALALGMRRAWRAGPGAKREEKRSRTRAAKNRVEQWAARPDARELTRHLENVYGPPDYVLALIPLHPQGPALTANQVLEQYRAHHDCRQLLICVTGPVSPGARGAAHQLASPAVRVLDGGELTRVVERSGLALPDPPARKLRLPALALGGRGRAPAMIGYGLTMLAFYLISGRLLYLCLAMALMLFSAICLRKRGAPDQLF